MALGNYTQLQASIADWLSRTDLSAVIPDFVTIAESRIARDLRIRKLIMNATANTTPNVQSVPCPSDMNEIENIGLSSTNPPVSLGIMTPEIMDIRFPFNFYPGQPKYYTILGDVIQLGPTPDAVYTVSIDYYQRLPALSVTPTNWLLTNHPMIYLAGCLHEAYLYLKDEERAAVWNAKYGLAKDDLQRMDDDAVYSGSAMRVRAA
jgi:hypothetical protein